MSNIRFNATTECILVYRVGVKHRQFCACSAALREAVEEGSRVRLIWAQMRLEFGVVRPNILFGRTGATENVSGIIIFIYFF